jgi:glycosyltransferase involved in cell wall biosynthesis
MGVVEPLKVAILTHFPEDPDAPRGGVEAVSVNLARALAVYEDLEIHILTMSPGSATGNGVAWEGVMIHRLPEHRGSTLVHAVGRGRREISRYLARLAPDLVHAHDTYGLMVKGIAVPRVFTIHGFIHGDTLVSGKRWPLVRSRIWRWIETAGWADQPHIISISPYVRERLSGIATGVIHDVDNPIAGSFFDIPRRERPDTVFSAAVISPRKNTLSLIDAFARLVAGGIDAELRLAGPMIDSAYGRRVEERIREHGLGGRVVLLGSVPAGQVREELSSSAVFALVSLEENSPMGIEEAMAAGVPVVTSNRCGMPYMVRDGESGYLVNPNDPEDIARRLGRLLRDGELRKAMGKRSRRIALERFHPAVVARRTHEIYLEALGRFDHAPNREDHAVA